MRKVAIASVTAVVAAIMGAGAGVPVGASATPRQGLGVTGTTSWYPEIKSAIARMNSLGVPIRDGCSGLEKYCIVVSHYNAKDGNAAYFDGKDVHVNDFYDNKSSPRRVSLWMHELGHAAGLHHSNACDSAMYHTFPACGSYILGYSPSEQQQIKEEWE